MAVTDWNWRLATDLQDYPWDCAACSVAWCLRTIGRTETEDDVIAGLGPTRISPSLGLLDASGAGLVSYLGELGIPADNNPSATWQDIESAAGFQPMVIGGRNWCHWVAVRMGGSAYRGQDIGHVLIMNPSPGYRNVWQSLQPFDIEQLGPFSAVWLSSW